MRTAALMSRVTASQSTIIILPLVEVGSSPA
jgi:hypothetical protein